jgi:hypothetical protein
MASLLKFSIETHGTSKLVFQAHLKTVQVACCKITWFPIQNTAHVWFAAPCVYKTHGVTSFQKFEGSLQELTEYYTHLFNQMVWLFVPILQNRATLDMLLFQLKGVDSRVAALVRCLVFVKNNIPVNKKYGTSKCKRCHPCTESPVGQKRGDRGDRVDVGVSNPATAQ